MDTLSRLLRNKSLLSRSKLFEADGGGDNVESHKDDTDIKNEVFDALQDTSDLSDSLSEPDIDNPDVDETTMDNMELNEKPHENPLDNSYALNYTLGQEVSLQYCNASSNHDSTTGFIDGYDSEGFYKVKWKDGSTTSGLTDIALAELVKVNSPVVSESNNNLSCICGSHNIIREGDSYICDDCGREVSNTKTNKRIVSRPANVSTSVSESITEEADPETLSNLVSQYNNVYWSSQSDLEEDMKSAGFEVLEFYPQEYVILSPIDDDNDDDTVYKVPMIYSGRSFVLEFDKLKSL